MLFMGSIDTGNNPHMSTGFYPLPTKFVCGYIPAMEKRSLLSRIELLLPASGKTERAASIEAGNPDVIRDLRRNPDRSPRLSTLIALAKSLNTSPEWLMFEVGGEQDGIKKVPLITWVSAGAFQAADTIMDISDFPTIDIAGLPEGDWFALKVDGDSMDRISPPGSVIAVNRDEKQLIPNRCYVIANEEGEVTYKRYRSSPDRFEPVSVNTTHETLFPNGSVRVIGRVVRSIYDL